MATIFYDDDADIAHLAPGPIAVLGFGSQGHAHALNLRDSGFDVRVGLYDGSPSRARAEAAGFAVMSTADAVRGAAVVAVLTPDTGQGALFRDEIAPSLTAGQTLLFAHGFAVRYQQITPPDGVDVVLVAPKAPGHRVREVFAQGGGVPALVAVAQDASGRALDVALAYAKGIGSTRAGVLRTTFAEETETDLFGEQAVLCGGVTAVVKAGFETLVEAGYQPEIAYFECLHELKLIVDLMYQGGLSYMRYSISDTAEYGDYVAGPRLVTEQTRATMRELLADIQSGDFAEQWIAENRAGRPAFERQRAADIDHPIERVGRELRRRMPFVQPREIVPGTSEAVAAAG